MPITFDWDKSNIGKNLIKHTVTDREAEEVFESEWKFIFKDEKHSQGEERYGLYGRTRAKRLLFQVYFPATSGIPIGKIKRISEF